LKNVQSKLSQSLDKAKQILQDVKDSDEITGKRTKNYKLYWKKMKIKHLGEMLNLVNLKIDKIEQIRQDTQERL